LHRLCRLVLRYPLRLFLQLDLDHLLNQWYRSDLRCPLRPLNQLTLLDQEFRLYRLTLLDQEFRLCQLTLLDLHCQ
jgi:hypothetical protein